MNMINILAPVRNFETAVMQVDAGADEIYLGVDYGDFDIYSYSGRFRSMNHVQTQVNGVEELKKISEYAKKNKVMVQLAANMHYYPPQFEEGYIQFIKDCAPYIDQVIVSNVGMIRKLQKMNLGLNIAAGSFTFIPNSDMVKFLKELGVVRVVLPHATKINEIAEIHSAVPDIELEIFSLIGGGNNCGRCMMFHSPLRDDIGPGCRAKYDVTYDGKLYSEVSYMDAAADCALCSMLDLINAGAYSMKIVGREMRNEVVASQFTEMFVAYRKCIERGMSKNDAKKYLSDNVFGWDILWVERFCKNGRCKFNDTKVTKSYI